MHKKINTKQNAENNIEAGLYVVSTPIGNLKDITYRAVEVLSAVDSIACEDTRVSAKLLNHYEIKKPLISYHEHSEEKVLSRILSELKDGKAIAIITDAGTPLISDPGFQLVKAARENGIKVFTIPGPSASLADLSISALPSDRFSFIGFPPPKSGKRKELYGNLKSIPITLIFFESPNRLIDSLADMLAEFDNRNVFVGRELTKLYEEGISGTIAEVLKIFSERETIKGEIVIVLEGTSGESAFTMESIEGMLKELMQTNSLKDSVAEAAAASGMNKKEIYNLALKLQQEK